MHHQNISKCKVLCQLNFLRPCFKLGFGSCINLRFSWSSKQSHEADIEQKVGGAWADLLPEILWALRTTQREQLGTPVCTHSLRVIRFSEHENEERLTKAFLRGRPDLTKHNNHLPWSRSGEVHPKVGSVPYHIMEELGRIAAYKLGETLLDKVWNVCVCTLLEPCSNCCPSKINEKIGATLNLW